MVMLHTAMMGKASDFTATLDANVLLLRQLAGKLIETIVTEKCRVLSEDDVMRQVQAWQRDSLLRELRSIYRQEQSADPLSQGFGLSEPRPHSNSVDPKTDRPCSASGSV